MSEEDLEQRVARESTPLQQEEQNPLYQNPLQGIRDKTCDTLIVVAQYAMAIPLVARAANICVASYKALAPLL